MCYRCVDDFLHLSLQMDGITGIAACEGGRFLGRYAVLPSRVDGMRKGEVAHPAVMLNPDNARSVCLTGK